MERYDSKALPSKRPRMLRYVSLNQGSFSHSILILLYCCFLSPFRSAKRSIHSDPTAAGYFRGSATTLLGVATGDTDIEAPESTPGSTTKGLKLRVNAGDVVVQPAGTAHSQPETDGDLRFVALFPWVSGLGIR